MKKKLEPKIEQCKFCGRKVIWLKTSDGKRIAVDAVPACYEVTAEFSLAGMATGERNPNAYVIHFATCPKVNCLKGSPTLSVSADIIQKGIREGATCQDQINMMLHLREQCGKALKAVEA